MSYKNNFPIFVYWENSKNSNTPELIKKCYKTMKKHLLKNIIFLNESNLHKYIHNYKLKDCSRIKYIAQKVDYYRSIILYENGGMWIDSDTIILKNFDKLIKEFELSNLELGCDTTELNNNIINIQYLMVKKKSNIIKKWVDSCEKIILSNKHIKWSDLGGTLLGRIYNNHFKDKLLFKIPINFRLTVGYKNFEKYYTEDKNEKNNFLNEIINKKPYIICLYGTFMYKKNIGKNTLLSELFNYNV